MSKISKGDYLAFRVRYLTHLAIEKYGPNRFYSDLLEVLTDRDLLKDRVQQEKARAETFRIMLEEAERELNQDGV